MDVNLVASETRFVVEGNTERSQKAGRSVIQMP